MGRYKLRIPVKLITGSGAKLDSDSGQTGHRSERSDAGVGTKEGSGRQGSHRGLSPHGRGNQGERYPGPAKVGSIPARAGEPGLLALKPWTRTVYPRTGGGTRDGCRDTWG